MDFSASIDKNWFSHDKLSKHATVHAKLVDMFMLKVISATNLSIDSR
jgi:hypothetical protein